ncbi:MAG: hypothetical protein ACRYFS_18520 [Janthinobacterium lividum]
MSNAPTRPHGHVRLTYVVGLSHFKITALLKVCPDRPLEKSLREALPSEDEIAGVASDFGIGHCVCLVCRDVLMGKPAIIECRHCHCLLDVGVPGLS